MHLPFKRSRRNFRRTASVLICFLLNSLILCPFPAPESHVDNKFLITVTWGIIYGFLFLVHFQLVTSSQNLSGEAPIVGNKMSRTDCFDWNFSIAPLTWFRSLVSWGETRNFQSKFLHRTHSRWATHPGEWRIKSALNRLGISAQYHFGSLGIFGEFFPGLRTPRPLHFLC